MTTTFRPSSTLRILLQVVAIGLALTACSGVNPAIEASDAATIEIADGARDGLEGFYFLPPMLEAPPYDGVFDAMLSPVVQVCTTIACETLHATFSMTEGSGAEIVRVSEEDGHYIVNWHTNQTRAVAGEIYRVRVLVNEWVLGHADVAVVRAGREARTVRSGGGIALVVNQTLPVKFRIETGIVGAVVVSPAAATLEAGASQRFTATLQDLHGNPLVGPKVTWSSGDDTVATVDADDGLATGVSAGATTLTASAVPASGTAQLDVTEPSGTFATRAGGTGAAAATAVATLLDGSAIVTGQLVGNATFGTTTLTSGDSVHAFVAKTNPDGSWAWAAQAGGTDSNEIVEAWGVATLADGSAIVTGTFLYDATFGATTPLTGSGNSTVFVAKTNPDGNWVWATQAGGTSSNETVAVSGVATLADGSAIVTGYFYGNATFGETTLTKSSASFNFDTFVAKTDADGDWVWATQAGGTGGASASGVATLGDGSAIVTGFLYGDVTFGATTLTSSSFHAFVAKTDPDGGWAWATQAGGTGGANAYGVATLGDGSAIVTGFLYGDVTFGTTTLTGSSNYTVFVAKTDPYGSWAWAAHAGGTRNARARGVATLLDGSAIVTGYFFGDATFGPTTLISSGSPDAFVAKLSASGAW